MPREIAPSGTRQHAGLGKRGRGRARRAVVASLAALVPVLLWAASSRAAAPFGNVLKLDGSDDYATIADNASLDIGDTDGEDFTVETSFYVSNADK